MRLILYSKPGCHLCEGLEEKLRQVQSVPIALEIRDITTREDWFQQFQYEIPVVMMGEEGKEGEELGFDGSAQPNGGRSQEAGEAGHWVRLPRVSPRASIAQVEQMLQKYWSDPAQ